METREFVDELKRMMDSLRESKGAGRDAKVVCDKIDCSECPFQKAAKCLLVVKEPSAFLTATEIVEEWRREHPKKTNKDVLFEKFPGARLGAKGVPTICACHLGIVPDRDGCSSCEECWNSEYKGFYAKACGNCEKGE